MKLFNKLKKKIVQPKVYAMTFVGRTSFSIGIDVIYTVMTTAFDYEEALNKSLKRVKKLLHDDEVTSVRMQQDPHSWTSMELNDIAYEVSDLTFEKETVEPTSEKNKIIQKIINDSDWDAYEKEKSNFTPAEKAMILDKLNN